MTASLCSEPSRAHFYNSLISSLVGPPAHAHIEYTCLHTHKESCQINTYEIYGMTASKIFFMPVESNFRPSPVSVRPIVTKGLVSVLLLCHSVCLTQPTLTHSEAPTPSSKSPRFSSMEAKAKSK